jgi:hypothetical protein
MNAELFLSLAFISVSYVYWMGMRQLRDTCESFTGSRCWGLSGVAVMCYATLVGIIALVTYGVIFDVDYPMRQGFANAERYLVGLLVLMLWGLIQYSCLYQSHQAYRQRQDAEWVKNEVFNLRRAGMIVQPETVQLLRSQRSLRIEAPGCTREKCFYYGQMMGNGLLGIAFVVIETILVDELENTGKAKSSSDTFYVELFISFLILIIMAFYIPFSASRLRLDNKHIYTLAFAVFLPLLIIIGVHQALNRRSSTVPNLVHVMLILIPLFGLYLITLHYVRKNSENMYRVYLTVSGFGFIIPTSISFTLYYINYLSISNAIVVLGFILFRFVIRLSLG